GHVLQRLFDRRQVPRDRGRADDLGLRGSLLATHLPPVLLFLLLARLLLLAQPLARGVITATISRHVHEALPRLRVAIETADPRRPAGRPSWFADAIASASDQYRYASGLYGPSTSTARYSAWSAVSFSSFTPSLARCNRATFSSSF